LVPSPGTSLCACLCACTLPVHRFSAASTSRCLKN
jgi:hypothetical protein